MVVAATGTCYVSSVAHIALSLDWCVYSDVTVTFFEEGEEIECTAPEGIVGRETLARSHVLTPGTTLLDLAWDNDIQLEGRLNRAAIGTYYDVSPIDNRPDAGSPWSTHSELCNLFVWPIDFPESFAFSGTSCISSFNPRNPLLDMSI